MNRNVKIDGIKAILIFLVVLGHMKYGGSVHSHLTKMIYAFHMTAFVVLSGYLTSFKSDVRKRVKWAVMTLGIYIVAQVISYGFLTVIPALRNGTLGDVIQFKKALGIVPCFGLWYLVSLVWWRVIVWFAKERISNASLLWIACVFSFVGGCFPLGCELSFQRTLAFMPAFVLGCLLRNSEIDLTAMRIPVWMCCLLLPIGFGAALWFPKFVPSSPCVNIPYDMFLRAGQCLLSLVLTFLALRILSVFPVEKMARWGRYTLWVYVGHAILIRVQNIKLPQLGVSLDVFGAIFVSLLYIVVFSAVAGLFYQVRLKNGR